MREPDLAQFSIESFFPAAADVPYLSAPEDFHEPLYYIEFFDKVRSEKKPLEFSVADVELNFGSAKPMVSIENFATKRAWGCNDVYYKLDLQEYRPYNSSAVSGQGLVVEEMPEITARETTQTPPVTYTVKSGDTLWAIAQKYLGSGSRYPEIAVLNAIANPNLIYPGQVFTIPSQ